ncbi:MAG TPA: tetratricopeptide repeat protein [Acidobacteriaceae bacterium]|nr:tetratricopeptide repeat protein [Acidobacteriaceae bacterium]
MKFPASILNLRGAVLTAGAIALLAAPCVSRAADLASATDALLNGNSNAAVAQLKQVLSTDPSNGQAHLLLCRAYYAQSLATPAASECTAALRTLTNDSTAQDWAGRAYGMQANSAGPIAGLRLAFKVRNAFEAAVRLNPLNGDAVNDLSEYYIDAPSIVGGGFEKAALLADRSAAELPQNAHRTRAMSAEKQKDYTTAEREFRAATAVANKPNAWADLGAFYSRRSQSDQAVEALRRAIALDPTHDATLVDAATTLTELNREPRLAERALRDYLASRSKSDAAPAFRVHVTLAKLLRIQGNTADAKIELGRSLDLATDYAPARKELAALEHQTTIAAR